MRTVRLFKLTVFFLALSSNTFAQTNIPSPVWDNTTAVQRSISSSFQDYAKYLALTEKHDFANAYIEHMQLRENNTEKIQSCLESLFTDETNKNNENETISICDSSISTLLANPLNQQGKEILSNLLDRLFSSDKYQKSKNFSFYSHLKKTIQAAHNKIKTRSLEVKAWYKLMNEQIFFQDTHLLVNGQEYKIDEWLNQGMDIDLSLIYQWALISNTHEPIIYVGNFSDFAKHSLKNLNPFYGSPHQRHCPEEPQNEPKTFGLTKVAIFLSDQCLLTQEKHEQQIHLGDLPPSPKLVPDHSNVWIWSAVAVIGVGLAIGLQNKKVTFSLPF